MFLIMIFVDIILYTLGGICLFLVLLSLLGSIYRTIFKSKYCPGCGFTPCLNGKLFGGAGVYQCQPPKPPAKK